MLLTACDILLPSRDIVTLSEPRFQRGSFDLRVPLARLDLSENELKICFDLNVRSSDENDTGSCPCFLYRSNSVDINGEVVFSHIGAFSFELYETRHSFLPME
jgi:hypothetical protein